MAIQDVLQFGNLLLRQSCAEVTDFEAPEVQRTLTDLKDTLHDLQFVHGKGGGVAAPQFMQGQSLRPLVEGKEVPWREELFLESLYTGRDTPFQEGIRFKNWKYIRMYDGVQGYREQDVNFAHRSPEFEMLFDLDDDPREMNNLVSSAAHAEILTTLRNKCARYSQALNLRRKGFLQSVGVQTR